MSMYSHSVVGTFACILRHENGFVLTFTWMVFAAYQLYCYWFCEPEVIDMYSVPMMTHVCL